MTIIGKPAVVWLEGSGVQLEWDVGNRHLEIEIVGETLPYLIEEDGGTILDSDEIVLGPSEAVMDVRELFNWLFTGDRRSEEGSL